MKKHLAFLSVALLATAAHAQYTGTQMLSDLREGGIGYVTAGNFTRGVVDGIAISHFIAEGPRIFCIPRDVSTGRVIEVVRRRLEDEPLIGRHESAVGFVVLAVTKEWPCRPGGHKRQGAAM